MMKIWMLLEIFCLYILIFPMVTIPPEVLKRITQTWNVAFVTNESKYPVTPVAISGNEFFATQDHYNSANENRWIYCWYPLKDI